MTLPRSSPAEARGRVLTSVGFDVQEAGGKTTLTLVRLETVCDIASLCVWRGTHAGAALCGAS